MASRVLWLFIAAGLLLAASPAAAATTCVFITSGTRLILTSDCETDETLLIPDSMTLDGNGRSITAFDPPGGHFVGAVVRNAGPRASVRDLIIDTSELASVCDGAGPPDQRLRGILFEGAAGTITRNRVLNINQGESGCQEGHAIEVRNFADQGGQATTLRVSITRNHVAGYQKTGILVGGDVDADVERNTVIGLGPVDYIGQNGIQLGFGAVGNIAHNTVEQNLYTQSDAASTGIVLVSAGDAVEVVANWVSDNDVGIRVIASSGVYVARNDVANSTYSGIAIDGTQGPAEGNVIANNDLEGNAVGIDLFGGGAVANLVERNRLADHPVAAIQLAVDAGDNALHSNRVAGSGEFGVWVGTDGNTLTRNRIEQTDGTGLLVDGDANAVTANIVRASGALDIENAGANSYARNRCATSSGPPVDCP